MAIDFNKALDEKVKDSEKPPLPPVGHYVLQVIKTNQRSVQDGAADIIEFLSKGVSVYEDADDVDPDELAAFGKVTSIMATKSFYFNSEDEANFARTKYDMRRFMEEHLQIDGAPEMTNRECIAAAKNHQYVAQIGHRPDKNKPDDVYIDIKRTAPLD